MKCGGDSVAEEEEEEERGGEECGGESCESASVTLSEVRGQTTESDTNIHLFSRFVRRVCVCVCERERERERESREQTLENIMEGRKRVRETDRKKEEDQVWR